jgi:hypothetical protein
MEVELDLTLDDEELFERLAIMASDEDIKIVCYTKSRRVVVKEINHVK